MRGMREICVNFIEDEAPSAPAQEEFDSSSLRMGDRWSVPAAISDEEGVRRKCRLSFATTRAR